MASIQRVDRTKPWLAPYRGPDRRQHCKTFARKIDSERWLKVPEAETLTGQWVDPTAGAETFDPNAEEWMAVKHSTVGESTHDPLAAACWAAPWANGTTRPGRLAAVTWPP